MKPLSLLGAALCPLFAVVATLQAQTVSPSQELAQMDQRREQVISRLSLGEKMKLRSGMAAIQNNPRFVAANQAVTSAATPEDQIKARKALAKVKLDLLEQQDPSLKPIVEKIRAAEAAALH